MGDTTATLNGIEDADLPNTVNTLSVESRDGFLPIGEVQVGFETYGHFPNGQRVLARIGLEGQLWGDVGSASQLDGNVGFVGFHVGVGFTR